MTGGTLWWLGVMLGDWSSGTLREETGECWANGQAERL